MLISDENIVCKCEKESWPNLYLEEAIKYYKLKRRVKIGIGITVVGALAIAECALKSNN